MKLNTLNVSLYKKGKRYGRGIGSGKGKTAGRGVLKVRKQDLVYLLRVLKGGKCLFIEDFLKEGLMQL